MASLLTLTYSQPTLALEPGDVLIKEGDIGGDMYVLESGRLTVERDGVPLATISSAGALVGEMSSGRCVTAVSHSRPDPCRIGSSLGPRSP